MDHPLRVAPLPDATRQRLGQAEPAFRPAQQNEAAVRRDQPAPEIGGHLLATYGWKIEREQDIFGHGGRGRFRCLGRRTLDNDFLPNTNDLRHVRHHIAAPQRIERARVRQILRIVFTQFLLPSGPYSRSILLVPAVR